MRLLVTPSFVRATKKLRPPQKKELDDAVRGVSADPMAGEAKVGGMNIRQRNLRTVTLERMWGKHTGSFGSFVSKLDRDGVRYLSHSKVSTVERCRQCFYNQYVLKIPAKSTAIQTGTLVHEAAQFAYERIRAGGHVDFAALAEKTAAKHPEPSHRRLVANGVVTLSEHLWTDSEVVGVEEPFFLDISADLPPVIGVIDLILRKGPRYLVIDHKTGKQFTPQDEGQLVLYAEHVRQRYGAGRCDGVFDQYRMVPNLAKVRTPVHRRTAVRIGPKRTAALVRRYQEAWESIQSIRSASDVRRGYECWYCS